jgi:hypothetical protein
MASVKAARSERPCSKCGSTWVRIICVARVSVYRDSESGEILDDVNVLDDKPVAVAGQCLDCGVERTIPLFDPPEMRMFCYSPPKLSRRDQRIREVRLKSNSAATGTVAERAVSHCLERRKC